MVMANIFSKRQKKIRGEVIDVYQYEELPDALRVQLIQIIKDSIGHPANYNSHYSSPNEADRVYIHIHSILTREYGVFSLYENANNDFEALAAFLLGENNIEKCLDLIELCLINLEKHVKVNAIQFRDITYQSVDDAIEEINERFKEHGVGYQYESGQIIRVDSQIIHADIIKPTLYFLTKEPLFLGPNEEFLSAYEHYRHKRYKESLNDCLKSFESLMKSIHIKNNWTYNNSDTASKLINSCLNNNLIPSYLQSQFTSLKTMLETGISTIRNRNSGHGQGAESKDVPKEMVSYMLHLTATNLLFLCKCEENLHK